MIINNELQTPLFQKKCGSEFGESIIETNELTNGNKWNFFGTTSDEVPAQSEGIICKGPLKRDFFNGERYTEPFLFV